MGPEKAGVWENERIPVRTMVEWQHVLDEDLIRALDSGQLPYAALDALWPSRYRRQARFGCTPKLP